jgi:hypothetical protein
MSGETIFNCAVIIPIYKENLSSDEEISLRQCLSVLGAYPIVFVAPQKLNCEKYGQICSEYDSNIRYELFKDKFFNGLNGYNALMVSGSLYKRFLNYRYILVYQLDAFVFEDKLAFWCKQDYDYAGGPVFDPQRGANTPKHTNFLNGGFSLRKTKSFYELTKTKLRLSFFLYLLWSKFDVLNKKQTVFNLFMTFFLFLAITFLKKVFRLQLNEDYEWSTKIKKYGKIAPFEEALRFSFDSCPEYAFKLADNALPFGCHGWPAYYNRLFWKKFIDTRSKHP